MRIFFLCNPVTYQISHESTDLVIIFLLEHSLLFLAFIRLRFQMLHGELIFRMLLFLDKIGGSPITEV